MKKPHYYILIAVALLIALVLLPQAFLEKTAYRLFRSSENIGKVKDVIGKTEKSFAGSSQRVAANAGDTVSFGDSFITHGDSKILFVFDPSFWLMPYSKIEFLKNADGSVNGHLIYGEIKKLEANPDALPIALNFEEKTITEAEFTSAPEPIEVPMAPGQDFKTLAVNQATLQSDIEKQIFQTLLLQKKYFQTCFVKLYKKQNGPPKGGETTFDLLIQVNGVIEKTNVTSSDIQDTDYLDCLKQVFRRVRFKNIVIKEPIHATFPLSIETP